MTLTPKKAKILLIAVIAARATSFCFSKMCLLTLSQYCLLGLRFTTAFLILTILFYKNIKDNYKFSDLVKGILLGLLYFMVMICEYTGLKTTNSSTASFIENMAIAIVPFLNIPLTGKPPTVKNLVCVCLAVVGIGLLTLTDNGFSFTRGNLYLLTAAFFYAAAIILTNYLSKSGNALNMGIFQVGTIGSLGIISSIIHGSFVLPSTANIYIYILVLAVICTGFGYTLQPVAQSMLSAETASIYCIVNPLVASIIGILFMHELPTLLNILGELIIVCVLFISNNGGSF